MVNVVKTDEVIVNNIVNNGGAQHTHTHTHTHSARHRAAVAGGTWWPRQARAELYQNCGPRQGRGGASQRGQEFVRIVLQGFLQKRKPGRGILPLRPHHADVVLCAGLQKINQKPNGFKRFNSGFEEYFSKHSSNNEVWHHFEKGKGRYLYWPTRAIILTPCPYDPINVCCTGQHVLSYKHRAPMTLSMNEDDTVSTRATILTPCPYDPTNVCCTDQHVLDLQHEGGHGPACLCLNQRRVHPFRHVVCHLAKSTQSCCYVVFRIVQLFHVDTFRHFHFLACKHSVA